MIVLSGARIFDGERFFDDHALVIELGRIVAVVPYAERPHGAARDLAGGLLAPGYIDVQVNGGGGVLFNEDPTPEGIARIAAAHRQHGTVGLLPTLVTDAPQVMAAAIAARHGVGSLRHSASIWKGPSWTRDAGARTHSNISATLHPATSRQSSTRIAARSW